MDLYTFSSHDWAEMLDKGAIQTFRSEYEEIVQLALELDDYPRLWVILQIVKQAKVDIAEVRVWIYNATHQTLVGVGAVEPARLSRPLMKARGLMSAGPDRVANTCRWLEVVEVLANRNPEEWSLVFCRLRIVEPTMMGT